MTTTIIAPTVNETRRATALANLELAHAERVINRARARQARVDAALEVLADEPEADLMLDAIRAMKEGNQS